MLPPLSTTTKETEAEDAVLLRGSDRKDVGETTRYGPGSRGVGSIEEEEVIMEDEDPLAEMDINTPTADRVAEGDQDSNQGVDLYDGTTLFVHACFVATRCRYDGTLEMHVRPKRPRQEETEKRDSNERKEGSWKHRARRAAKGAMCVIAPTILYVHSISSSEGGTLSYAMAGY